MNGIRYAALPNTRCEELMKPAFPALENDVPGTRR